MEPASGADRPSLSAPEPTAPADDELAQEAQRLADQLAQLFAEARPTLTSLQQLTGRNRNTISEMLRDGDAVLRSNTATLMRLARALGGQLSVDRAGRTGVLTAAEAEALLRRHAELLALRGQLAEQELELEELQRRLNEEDRLLRQREDDLARRRGRVGQGPLRRPGQGSSAG